MKKKTPEQIEQLKHQWEKDPCWDIEETEGFGAHKKELKAYRLQLENKWQELYKNRLAEKAKKMGIPDNLILAEHIISLEDWISKLQKEISSIRGQLYSGR